MAESELHILTNREITKKLLNNPFLSDVSFEVQGVILYAHSLELAKKSPIFALQCKGNYGERKLIRIDNANVSYEHFYEFLTYIYCDSCKTTADNIIGLLTLAIKYHMYDLENLIWDVYQTNLTPSLIIRFLNFCVEENYNELLNLSKYLTTLHFSKISKEPQILSIGQNTLKCILEHDFIGKDCNEKSLFDVVLKWLNSNRSKVVSNGGVLKEVTDDLLKSIRFPCISEEEFLEALNLQSDLFSVVEVDAMLKSIVKGEKEKRITLNVEYMSLSDEYVNGQYRLIIQFDVKEPAMLKGIFTKFKINRSTNIIIRLSLVSLDNKSILKTISHCYNSSIKYIINLPKPYQLQSMQKYEIEIEYTDAYISKNLPLTQPNVFSAIYSDSSLLNENWLGGLILDS